MWLTDLALKVATKSQINNVWLPVPPTKSSYGHFKEYRQEIKAANEHLQQLANRGVPFFIGDCCIFHLASRLKKAFVQLLLQGSFNAVISTGVS